MICLLLALNLVSKPGRWILSQIACLSKQSWLTTVKKDYADTIFNGVLGNVIIEYMLSSGSFMSGYFKEGASPNVQIKSLTE